jgi:hypothetical protein
MIRMKVRDLSMQSCRMLFPAVAAAALLLMAGCSSSSNPAAVGPSDDAQAGTVFGDEIALTGYSVQFRDGHTEMELRWKALRKPAGDYSVFVHALDSSGAIAFQGDHSLKNPTGSATTSWTAGEAVSDRFLMMPPAGHAAGAYAVRIGLYTPTPMKVLPLSRTSLPTPADGWKDHAILLSQVECK